VRRQRVTTFAAFSAGSTTARNYGRGFRVLETGQRLIIANGQALEQMFVLEIGA
jgi:hypothetical protein